MLISQNNRGRRVADPSSGASQLVSDANNASQSRLFEQLVAARLAKGVSVDDVARLLHAETSIVEDIESGDYEPNLTELRQYAWAIEAVIDFRVHACAAEPLARFRSHMMAVSVSDEVWNSTTEVSWSDMSDYVANTPAIQQMVEGIQHHGA